MKTLALRTFGLKQTKGRSRLLQILQEEQKPVDVQHILTHFREDKTRINEVTVYRILDAFVSRGLIKRLEFQEGKFRYELSQDEHHHLICENCGRIEDLSDCSIEGLEKEIKEKKQFSVSKHVLEFYGLCQTCQ